MVVKRREGERVCGGDELRIGPRRLAREFSHHVAGVSPEAASRRVRLDDHLQRGRRVQARPDRRRPSPALQRTSHFADDPSTLFVFPDGTWVRAEAPAAERVRAMYAMKGSPPSLPTADGDVAWELCGVMDPNDLSLPYDVWRIRGNRVAARLFGSRLDGELVYPFDSPALAARAAEDQRLACQAGSCSWLQTSQVEGSMVRFGVAVLTAPTRARGVLGIAHTTPMLAVPPPERASRAGHAAIGCVSAVRRSSRRHVPDAIGGSGVPQHA